MPRSPMNPETRAKARELFEDGHSRNSIARKLDLDPATITRWAKEANIKFDRSQAALAVRAHTIDLAESRIDLAKKIQQVAHDLLDSLDGKYLVYSFGGAENTYAEHELDSPPVEVIRSAIVTAGIAFDKATKVIEQTPEGLRGAESLLDRLEAGLTRFDDGDDDDIAQ